MEYKTIEQTKLEENAIELRKEHLSKNDFQNVEGRRYDASHPYALSTPDSEDHPERGKGTGKALGYTPFGIKNKAINYSNIDTKNGGGKYDIEKRKELMNINLYGEDHAYGKINTTKNELDGQVIIR